MQKPGQSAFRWIVRGELMVATGQRTDGYLFDKAALADPDWLVPLDIARVYLRYDQAAKAGTWIRKAAEKAPANAFVAFIEGRCHATAGNSSLARKAFDRCLQIAPNHEEAQLELSRLDSKMFSIGAHLRRLFG